MATIIAKIKSKIRQYTQVKKEKQLYSNFIKPGDLGDF